MCVFFGFFGWVFWVGFFGWVFYCQPWPQDHTLLPHQQQPQDHSILPEQQQSQDHSILPQQQTFIQSQPLSHYQLQVDSYSDHFKSSPISILLLTISFSFLVCTYFYFLASLSLCFWLRTEPRMSRNLPSIESRRWFEHASSELGKIKSDRINGESIISYFSHLIRIRFSFKSTCFCDSWSFAFES